MSLHPNGELVTVAYLRQITGLAGNVATALPADQTSWSDIGFVQVAGVGGSPDRTQPLAKPVLSLDFWATNPDTGRPPWNKASQLAEHVRADVHAHATTPRLVVTPAGYANARVITAFLLTEPRRIRDDAADYAHLSADLAVWWVEVPK